MGSTDRVQAMLAASLPLEDLANVVPFLLSFLGLGLDPAQEEHIRYLDAEAFQRRTFLAYSRLIEASAQPGRHPLVIVLDDIHWMDDASRELLQHLARHTRSDAILILGTYRGIEVTSRHPLDAALRDLMREELVERVVVKRLDQEGTAALMAATFGEQEISTGFADLVHRRTEGNLCRSCFVAC